MKPCDSCNLKRYLSFRLSKKVYGAFNSIMFDHARVRPRVLTMNVEAKATMEDGFHKLDGAVSESDFNQNKERSLYSSTVFGPTCDSIDVISRSVLLPKLAVGDYLYFTNMGAYTMAAASSFNGFAPSAKFYVCSVQPEYFEQMIKGPEESQKTEEEKKDSK